MDAIEGKVVNRGDGDDGILDLDLWLSEVAEDDESEPFQFTAGGDIYTLAGPDDFDWQQYARSTDNPNPQDVRPFVALLLGDEQYEKFCAIKKMPNRAIEKIVNDWQEHHGLTVPESRASRRSSQRTARPSKPTSKRRTK